MKRIRNLLVALGAAIAIGACSSSVTGPASLDTWDSGRENIKNNDGMTCGPELSQC